jgi:hypothetical protein
MFIDRRRSQSVLEYVTITAVVLFALLIMQIYVKRAYQGRLKNEADEVGEQYAPKHTSSEITTTTTSTSKTCKGNTALCGGNLAQGQTATISNSETTTTRKEKVDSFAAEQ